MIPPRVEVEWLDSQSDGRWQALPDALRAAEADDLLHRSIGFLIDDNERYVLLAASHREEREGEPVMVADVLQIPRPAVLSVRTLTLSARQR